MIIPLYITIQEMYFLSFLELFRDFDVFFTFEKMIKIHVNKTFLKTKVFRLLLFCQKLFCLLALCEKDMYSLEKMNKI